MTGIRDSKTTKTRRVSLRVAALVPTKIAVSPPARPRGGSEVERVRVGLRGEVRVADELLSYQTSTMRVCPLCMR